jgi:hypothetical protein
MIDLFMLAALTASCPADTPVATVMAAGFSCALGDKTFSAFDLSGVPTDARVQFGTLGPLFAVTLSRDGTFFSDGRTVFDYTVTAAAPNHFVQGTLGTDVSFPQVLTTATMNGTLLGPLTNGGTVVSIFGPGVSSVMVDDTAIISGPAELNSISNDFTQVMVSIPEPGEAALWAVGILGLAWIWSRRRE